MQYSKAQGAIEYLLLLGGVIIIAAIVIVVLTGIGTTAGVRPNEYASAIDYPCVDEGAEQPCKISIPTPPYYKDGVQICKNNKWSSCQSNVGFTGCNDGICKAGEDCLITDNDCDSQEKCYQMQCKTVKQGGNWITNCFEDKGLKICGSSGCPVGSNDWYNEKCCEDQGLPNYPGPDTENTIPFCHDTLDNDCDKKTDCADTQCNNIDTEIDYAKCHDAVDNDCDGATDCADGDCASVPGGNENTQATCNDNADNDCDGSVDCADNECNNDGWSCQYCKDGIVQNDNPPGYTEECDPTGFSETCVTKHGAGWTGTLSCRDRFASAGQRCTYNDQCIPPTPPNDKPLSPTMKDPSTDVQTYYNQYDVTLNNIHDNEGDTMTVECFASLQKDVLNQDKSCNNTVTGVTNSMGMPFFTYACNLTGWVEGTPYYVWCHVKDDKHGPNDWVNSIGTTSGSITKIPFPGEIFTININEASIPPTQNYSNTSLSVSIDITKTEPENIHVNCYLTETDLSDPNKKYCERDETHNIPAGGGNITYGCLLINGTHETAYHIGCTAHSALGAGQDAIDVSANTITRVTPVPETGYYGYGDVLVVYNSNPSLNGASRRLAEYYAGIHRIDNPNRLCGIATTTNETISEGSFNSVIKAGVQSCLTGGINYIVLMKGMPLKITDAGGNIIAAVDSTLTFAPQYRYINPYAGFNANGETKDYGVSDCGGFPQKLPLFNGSGSFNSASYGNTYLVTRIDSVPGDVLPDLPGTPGDKLVDGSKKMIDDAITANQNASPNPNGWFVFDYINVGSTDQKCRINTLIKRAYDKAAVSNKDLLDGTTESICSGYGNTPVLATVHGGKSMDTTCASHEPALTYAAGSLTEIFAAHTAYSHNGGRAGANYTLGIDLIKKGATASVGVLNDEGQDDDYADPYKFVESYSKGCVLADSYYLGTKYLAGIEIKIGDPKMHAFTGGCS